MAKASWLDVKPTSGSGDAIITLTPYLHTGRNNRTCDLEFSGSGTGTVTRKVIQKGIGEVLKDLEDVHIGADGGKITISGTTNSKSLTFTGGEGVTVASSYKANSTTINNGATIAGDPGADYSFTFEIEVTVSPNNYLYQITKSVAIRTAEGIEKAVGITQAGDTAYLTVPDGDITLEHNTTSHSINISSNTTWTIE